MDIPALQAFVAVADHGSFSAAAERIFLSQPAISKRIAALEADLGATLFDRIGRQVRLTPAGQALLDQARVILSEMDEARRRIASLSGAVTGPLRLGTSYHVGLHRLPAALRAFYAAHPGVHLDLRFMDSEAACQAVAQGELELAAVTLPQTPDPVLQRIAVWDDPFDVVVGRHHPLAAARAVSAATLAAHPAVLPAAGTTTRDIIVTALQGAGVTLQVGLEANYLEVIKMLVSVGLGWSALPHSLIDDDLKVVHIEGVRIRRELGLVTRAHRTLSPAAQIMIETVQHTA